MKKIILCLSVLVLIVLYSFKLEPFTIKTKIYEMGDQSKAPIRIVQVTDIQISRHYKEENLEKLIDQINQLKPDLFLFTGDLFEHYAQYGSKEEVIGQLSRIKTKYGSYGVWGNRDYGGGGQRVYREILGEGHMTLLENTGTTIETEDGIILYLAGLDDSLLGSPNGDLIKEQMKEDSDYRILLSHEPDPTEEYASYGFDLILAGHSHGGQVLLPFGGVKTALAKTYTKGFYSIGAKGDRETMLYVNTGIGTSHIPVRLGVPPQIAVFDIGI